MININLNKEASLAILEPEGTLSESDFDTISNVVDPYIEECGKLNGLIIYSKSFPGWDSFGTMLKHFKFVKNHQQKLSHIALVTDSTTGDLAEKIVSHFILAKVKYFPYSQLNDATN